MDSTCEQEVVVDLHGERAPRGVELDALEGFFDAFRRALREHARYATSRAPLKAGKPGPSIRAAAAFRVVGFRTGSGILTLEPLGGAESDSEAMAIEDEPAALRNLNALMDAVEDNEVPATVVDALEAARRTMGRSGSFGIKSTSGTEVRSSRITAAKVKVLRDSTPSEDDLEREVSVVGLLHLIDVEEAGRRVNVRATDGTDWICVYESPFEEQVASMLSSIVRVRGVGRRTSPRAGRLAIHAVEPLPAMEQTDIFTGKPRMLASLLHEQGVQVPQGLAALSDPGWGDDDEADRRFLEAMNLIDAG